MRNVDLREQRHLETDVRGISNWESTNLREYIRRGTWA